jgi:hypothetical protein
MQKPMAIWAENHEEDEQGDLDAVEPAAPEQIGHEPGGQAREHEDA